MSSQRSPRTGLTLVGNPGAGKSTILNGIAGQKIFKAGIAIGTGMTSVLQRYEKNEITLFDTPGLADISKKKQAGDELNEMLSANIPIKIVFVVTLDRGRVKPDDAMTIDLVLSAIHSVNTNDKFGIIINQVTTGVAKALEADPEKTALMRKQLTGNRSTTHWCEVLHDDQLADAADGMLMTPKLIGFFAGLPETKPREAAVSLIDTTDLKDKIKEQSLRIEELKQASEQAKQDMMKQLREEKRAAKIREEQFQTEMKRNGLGKEILKAAVGILNGPLGTAIASQIIRGIL